MSFKTGQCIYHVSGSGNVSLVTVAADESNGSVAVKYPNGQVTEIGTFHLFATETAANRAALIRTQTARVGGTTFVTKPR